MLNSEAVDARALVSVNHSTLRGLLVLRTTEVRAGGRGPGAAREGVLRPEEKHRALS